MGCGQSTPDSGQDRQVQREINDAKKTDAQVHKLLLLGAGGSGKSTFFKQLKIIHADGHTVREREGYRRQIYGQVIEAMQILVKQCRLLTEATEDELEEDEAAQNMREELAEEELEEYRIPEDFHSACQVLEELHGSTRLDEQTAMSLKTLWTQCSAVKKMFGHRNKICVPDSTEYFLDSIDRLASDDFLPEDKDILLVRYRTTGMTESQFEINGALFRVHDVGGQRNERKKWIHFFDGVTAVLFVISLSCYDEIPFEDVTDLDADVSEANNMLESVKVFQETLDQPTFQKTGFILFMNKADIMQEKIKRVPITTAFPDYTGPQDFQPSVSYITEVFISKNKNPEREMFAHVTTATDSQNVERLFNDVQQCVVNWSLKNAGLV